MVVECHTEGGTTEVTNIRVKDREREILCD